MLFRTRCRLLWEPRVPRWGRAVLPVHGAHGQAGPACPEAGEVVVWFMCAESSIDCQNLT